MVANDGQDEAGSPEEKKAAMNKAIENTIKMWDRICEESQEPEGKFKVVCVKNNYMMKPDEVRTSYEGMHQLLVNLLYTPKMENGEDMTFGDIFADNVKRVI